MRQLNRTAGQEHGVDVRSLEAGLLQADIDTGLDPVGKALGVTDEILTPDAGLETLEVDLPAVITTDLRLNEPRYVKLPDIMKAKKKPLDALTFAALGVEPRQQLKLVRFEPPPQRQKGVRVKDAAELVDALRKKGLL